MTRTQHLTLTTRLHFPAEFGTYPNLVTGQGKEAIIAAQHLVARALPELAQVETTIDLVDGVLVTVGTELTLPLAGAQVLGLSGTLAVLGRSVAGPDDVLGPVSTLRLSGDGFRERSAEDRAFAEAVVRQLAPGARLQWSSMLFVWAAHNDIVGLRPRVHPHLVHVAEREG